MARETAKIDKTRASRDGHEFHENWAARKSLQLILPKDDFIALAMEGFSEEDQKIASDEAIEIADVTLYYGKEPNFKDSNKVEIVQLKYSISHATDPFRHYNAKKTIIKFAKTYKSWKEEYGEKEVEIKLKFELVTNRPIYAVLEKAIQFIAEGRDITEDIKDQADQFKEACGFKGTELKKFAKKITFTGLAGNLEDNKQSLSHNIADWSGANASDIESRARLGSLKDLLRNKSGSQGENGNNLINLVDILHVLGVQEEKDLYPCPEKFHKIESFVKREQLSDAIHHIEKANKPFLIHAAGGVGKTSFLKEIAHHFTKKHEVILFDCFGGGAYRATEDSRHLPKNAFTHIINLLAQKGLCDLLIPSNNITTEEIIKRFRSRLKQAVGTLQRISSNKKILLLIDAIDNAADFAKERSEDCFAKEILRSIEFNQNIANVTIVLSCRTERRKLATDNFLCEEFELLPFSKKETGNYLKNKINNLTNTEVEVAHTRSEGNPRILEHLSSSDRGLLDKSEIHNIIELKSLLIERITNSFEMASRKGYNKTDLGSFLAGLSTLPPPVPIEDYAIAQGMEISEIESFVADLAPLLERTKPGIWFRDEPTETLIREKYASDDQALQKVAQNLFKQQDSSVYAAKALPELLQKMGKGHDLFELAFDERFPKTITSVVGIQTIRYARLKAAISFAVSKKDYNQLVRLLVEISTIEAINKRGSEYILNNPDLIIASNDVDSTRRLFELRPSWQGTRHARLAIANILSGETGEACRHARYANEWIKHFLSQDEKNKFDRKGFDKIDIAAIPLCFLVQKNHQDAIFYMKKWKDWYAYEVMEYLFSFIRQSELNVEHFLEKLSDPGIIIGALSFYDISNTQKINLIKKLTKACKNKPKIETNDRYGKHSDYKIQDGFLKASILALSVNLKNEASTICKTLKPESLGLSYFVNRNFYDYHYNSAPFIIKQSVLAAADGYEISAQDLLPRELINLWPTPIREMSDQEFFKKLKQKIQEAFEKSKKQKLEKDREPKAFSGETQRESEQFLNERLEILVSLSRTFTELLSSSPEKSDKTFISFIKAWSETRRIKENYSQKGEFNIFFDMLGREMILFFIWSRNDLSSKSIKRFLDELNEGSPISAHDLIKIVSILSRLDKFHDLAGELATTKAISTINKEDDVNHRASLYAQLSRAILPTCVEEAAHYFKAGLNQMDIIGSGDITFTNEILSFAASLKGEELEDKDFHTLTNICELNIYDEAYKFPWYNFAQGMSKVAGCKGIAKLGRWDSREKICLEYTLMPYLIFLIKDQKLDIDIALALLRICDPSDMWNYGVSDLAQVILDSNHPNKKTFIIEVITQFEENNPDIPSRKETKALHAISSKILGVDNEITVRLSKLSDKSEEIIDQQNNIRNYGEEITPERKQELEKKEEKNKILLKELIKETNPLDEISISKAVEIIDKVEGNFQLMEKYLMGIRKKVTRYKDRPTYIRTIGKFKELSYYKKTLELKACKESWCKLSKGLEKTFNELGFTLVQLHIDELIRHDDTLQINTLREIATLSGHSIIDLSVEVIKLFSRRDFYVPAPAWMSLASIICEKSDGGEGQKALTRLLNSNSAKLSTEVVDGEWHKNMYPANDTTDIAASLVWMKLGSPTAEDRWLAAHSIRRFASLGKWDILDKLITKMEQDNAGSFQAPELIFYQLHARLWLLIALARIAIDHPKELAKYSDLFKEIALNKNFPHVILQHFAASIIQSCVSKNALKLSAKDKKEINAVNISKYPLLKKKPGTWSNTFYTDRPQDKPKLQPEFFLDYDFNKNTVQQLANVFEKSNWEMDDLITGWVRKFDKNVESMYDSSYQMDSRSHTYGQQLGWHALFLSAGQLLAKYPVIDRSYGDLFSDWINEYILTRNDGLWLADGTDKSPLDTKINLLEKGKKESAIIGNKNTILDLIGIQNNDISVQGRWSSSDDIRVHISSALVDPKHIKRSALDIAKESPFTSYLPTYYYGTEEEEEDDDNHKDNFESWIVDPSIEANLDKHDILGIDYAKKRPYFSNKILKDFSLFTEDPFKRKWKNQNGKVVAISEVWGSSKESRNEVTRKGMRLKCSKFLLQEILQQKNMSLLIYVKLERYKKDYNSSGSFVHTTASVTIDKNLNIIFYKGHINYIYPTKY